VNKKQQQKHVGQSCRLRPTPTNSLGGVVDDAWTVVAADEIGLQLENHRTGHALRLGYGDAGRSHHVWCSMRVFAGAKNGK
jgi:hypothetical protein